MEVGFFARDRVEQHAGRKKGVFGLGQVADAVQHRVVFPVELFAPRLQRLVLDAVRQDVFAEVGKRDVLPPRLLAPHLERPFHVLHQQGGVHVPVADRCPRAGIRRAIKAPYRVLHLFQRQGAAAEQLVHLQVGFQLRCPVGIIVRQVGQQETGGLAPLRVVGVSFLHFCQAGIVRQRVFRGGIRLAATTRQSCGQCHAHRAGRHCPDQYLLHKASVVCWPELMPPALKLSAAK